MKEVQVEHMDEDGFVITDGEQDRCYIYYSEINELMQKIRKIAFEYKEKNINGQHSIHSTKEHTNTSPLYKSNAYQEYMESDEWREKRKRRLNMDAHRCVNCGGRTGLQVHHKEYGKVFDESMDDLVTLCWRCHDTVTRKGRCKDVIKV